MTKALSGGSKRKLCAAISMALKPYILYMDEPSTGVDVLTRRHLWRAIRAACEESAVVFTTQSMEEADALSTRVAILVKGSLVALGSAQHLKAKFGRELRLEVSSTATDWSTVLERIRGAFPGSEVVESWEGWGTFRVPLSRESQDLPAMYRRMQ